VVIALHAHAFVNGLRELFEMAADEFCPEGVAVVTGAVFGDPDRELIFFVKLLTQN
jgi:hypothetical protein